jgi:RHS repeat-associated protein
LGFPELNYRNNAEGKLENQFFPSGMGQRFSVTNTYDSNGYLNEVKKADGTVIWKMLEANALGQVKQSRLGTGLTTSKTYDDVHGMLTSIQTPGIQNNQYEFNPATDNLTNRIDVNRNLKESFEYNNVNSLTRVKVNEDLKQSLEYLPNGNIDSNGKTNSTTGLGKYYYEVKQEHAVSGIDNTDNIVSTDPQNISYTSFNKVDLITEGIVGEANYRTHQYLYGPDQQRRRTVFNNGPLQKTTYFIGSYEKEITGENIRELHYIEGGDGLAAVYIKTNGTGKLFYILKDHLGSIQYIRSEDGLSTEELSFDAWGRRRNPADYTDFDVAASNYLNRGFTGHEHLDAFGLIDMNGRVYDPILGRFLSPDPYVQMPGFTQSFNRYSYCLNNPLIFTDPSGELPVWALWPISWGGNWFFGGMDRWLNGKQSFKQAFNPLKNPVVFSGNYSPSDNKWSNYQVDAFKTTRSMDQFEQSFDRYIDGFSKELRDHFIIESELRIDYGAQAGVRGSVFGFEVSLSGEKETEPIAQLNFGYDEGFYGYQYSFDHPSYAYGGVKDPIRTTWNANLLVIGGGEDYNSHSDLFQLGSLKSDYAHYGIWNVNKYYRDNGSIIETQYTWDFGFNLAVFLGISGNFRIGYKK